MATLADLMTEDRRAKLSREMTHQQTYGQTDPQAQAMVDYARVTQDPHYVEPGLQGGVPTENVTGLGLSPLDLIGTGIGTKAATFGGSMLAALAGTAIASKASKGAKLSELAMAMPSQRGIFAGVNAKTANKANLEIAQKLKQQGVPDEQIWKETGWTFGFPDQKPRFEIPDNAARIGSKVQGDRTVADIASRAMDSKIGGYPKIGNVLQHEDLYSAYPATQDIGMEFPIGSGGAYSAENMGVGGLGRISIGNEVKGAATPLHELQHAIQEREGFARGGSPSNFDSGQMFSQKAKELQADLSQNLTGGLSSRPDEIMGAIKYGNPDELNAIAQKHGFGGIDDALQFLNKEDFKRTPFGQYQRLAGEAEARLTQARMNMTPEQRLANYPVSMFDVPVEQQIVRYGDGQAMSVPTKTEFELAHEVAQRNAALPVEQGGLGLPPNNTAMDRAQAMGFDTPAYHGTGLQANADDPSGALLAPDYRDYIETADNIPVRSALFTSTSPNVASGYATKQEGHVLPLLLNEGKQAWNDARGQLWIDYFKQRGLPEANARTARNSGYDSYKIKNVIDPYTMDHAELADTIAMVNPSNIRSRFAAFDPMQRNSANILAGGAAGAVGLSSLADLLYQPEYQQ